MSTALVLVAVLLVAAVLLGLWLGSGSPARHRPLAATAPEDAEGLPWGPYSAR